jgi:hypothetical protein
MSVFDAYFVCTKACGSFWHHFIWWGSTLQLSDDSTWKMHLLLWQVFHHKELVIMFFFELENYWQFWRKSPGCVPVHSLWSHWPHVGMLVQASCSGSSNCLLPKLGLSTINNWQRHFGSCSLAKWEFSMEWANFSRLCDGPVVGIATNYGLDNWRVGVRIPVGWRIFSSPYHPGRLWGPPNLLSN